MVLRSRRLSEQVQLYTIGQAIQNPNSFVCGGSISNWIAAASDGAAVNYCNLWNALTGSSGYDR